MAGKVSVDGLGDAIARELELYSEHVLTGTKTVTKEVMDNLVAETKSTAPVGRRRKHYRDQITSKKSYEDYRTIKYLWYVKAPDYRLSHLLNNGHAIHNGGRYSGTGFITKAHEKVLREYERRIREVIENGG